MQPLRMRSNFIDIVNRTEFSSEFLHDFLMAVSPAEAVRVQGCSATNCKDLPLMSTLHAGYQICNLFRHFRSHFKIQTDDR